jgi:hypothetical protein
MSPEDEHDGAREELRIVREALELIHDDDPGTRRRLRALRSDPSYEAPFEIAEPLVSVVIPTWSRPHELTQRAIPSALAQTHGQIEVVVVGDCSPPEVGDAVAALGDPRVSFHNLTVRGPYLEDDYRAWLASGTPAFNAGVAHARGLWIAPLGDDDEFEPDHVARLLAAARERRLEFVYGRGRVILPDGRETLLGEFPPRVTQVGLQSALYHAGLRFIELELGHALFGKPNDWGMVHRMMRVGVHMGMIEDVTVTYRPSLRAQTLESGRRAPNGPVGPPVNEPEEGSSRIRELERLLSEQHARSEALTIEAEELARRIEEVRRSRSWRLTSPLRRIRSRFSGV